MEDEWAPDDVQRRHVEEKHPGNPYDCWRCRPFIVRGRGPYDSIEAHVRVYRASTTDEPVGSEGSP